jgi:hypothetical protein
METRLREFIRVRCDCGEGLMVSRREFRDAFNIWNGGRAVYKNFQAAVERLRYPAVTRAYGNPKRQTAVYSGLCLRNGDEVPAPEVQEVTAQEVVRRDDERDQGASGQGADPQFLLFDNERFGEFCGARIRRTGGTPPMISILDLIAAVTGAVNPSDTWADVSKKLADVLGFCRNITIEDYKFSGQGQRLTPVTDARGAVVIINTLGGSRAATFRLKCADVVVRYLGGDETLIDEIRGIREVQERLPDDHPLRLFGETVEAERKAPVDPELEHSLKRQKLRNEVDLETVRGLEIKNRMDEEAARNQEIRGRSVVAMAEIRNQLLDVLSNEKNAPALVQMLSATRHNFASESVAQVAMLGAPSPEGQTSTAVIAAPVEQPPPPAITIPRRVSVLEVGRDRLGLRGQDLSAQRLSVVGLAVGRRWMARPGKGSIVSLEPVDGIRRWERTVKTGSVTNTTVFAADRLIDEQLASNRIRFSDMYLGSNEIGLGQVHNVWTYQATEAEDLIKSCFQIND